eukprot:492033-Rhodomonas_salina.1
MGYEMQALPCCSGHIRSQHDEVSTLAWGTTLDARLHRSSPCSPHPRHIGRTGQPAPQHGGSHRKAVDEIWPDCPPDIADFVPDCIIVATKQDSAKHPSRVIVFEFARSYTIEEDELLSVGAAKRN